jgi:dipeptidyl aminopeptidase/acylaminoacyl peptidase
MNRPVLARIPVLLQCILAGCASLATLDPAGSPLPTEAAPMTPPYPYEVLKGIRYIDDGNPNHDLTIYLPDHAYRKPAAVFIPGGEYFPEFVTFFSERGYTVLSSRVRNDTYQKETGDVFCSVAWTHTSAGEYGVETDQLVVVGGSMLGGTVATLASIDDTSPYMGGCPHAMPEADRVQGVVAFAGVFDYFEDDFFPGFIGNVAEFFGGARDDIPKVWADASAISWIDGSEPPFLLLHGMEDTNVYPHQSEIFADVLEEAGVDGELVMIPGEGHSSLIRSEAALAAMLAWLEEKFQ